MDNSKKQSDSKPDPIEQAPAVGQNNKNFGNAGGNRNHLGGADNLLNVSDDLTDDDDNDRPRGAPEQNSGEPQQHHSSRESTRPSHWPATSEDAIELDLPRENYSEAVENSNSSSDHLMPFEEADDSFQEDDLFDLFDDEFELPGEGESVSEDYHFNDPPGSQRDSLGIAEGPDYDAAAQSDPKRVSRVELPPGSEPEPEAGPEKFSAAEPVSEARSTAVPDADPGPEFFPDRPKIREPDDRAEFGAGEASEKSIGGTDSGDSSVPRDDGRYDKELFGMLNEDTASIQHGYSGERSTDHSADSEARVDVGKRARAQKYASNLNVVEPENELEMELEASIHSNFDDYSRTTAREGPDLAKFDRCTSETPIPLATMDTVKGGQKPDSEGQPGAPEGLDSYREGDAMKWLTLGFLVVLAVVVIVMGGYLFSLQSQIDEIHLLLPLDQNNVLDSQPPKSPDPANEAVIENLNARIDNLADTLELIANANPRNENSTSSESLIQPGSEKSTSGIANIENRVAAVLAGNAEIREINRRIDTLDKSLEEITRTINQHGSQIKNLNDLKNIQALRPESVKEVVQSSPVTVIQTTERSGAGMPRDNELTKKKPVGSAPVSPKPSAIERASQKGEWSVNLMSLAEEAVAKQQLESMLKKGVAAEIEKATISGKTWYRIRVTGFKTKQQARQYGKSIAAKLGLPNIWVTR